MNRKITQKGAANIIITMVYILISFVIIAMVTVSATDLLSKSKEQTNYQTMLEYFDKFNLALNDTINNKQITEFSFYNPGEIEIDCTNNKIIGRIDYSGEYRTEETIINDIITYKKNNQIFFEKSFDNQARIQLNCKNSILTTGKKTIQLNQFKYNELTKKIELDVFEKTKIHEDADWYNSNWTFRKKITINHTKVEEDLYNFPLLLKIDPITEIETLTEEQIQATLDLADAKSDGSGLVFTSSDGKTKLKREIESITSEGVLPYYIEETGGQRFVWTKIDLEPNETKQITISKTLNDYPNGEDVFDFFDDFKGTELSSKWTSGDGATLVFSEETLRINTGAITLTQPFDFNLQNNFIITTRSKTINHTTTYGGVTPGISSSSYSYLGNSNGDSKITMMKSINNTDFYVYAGSGSTTTHDIVSTKISTINLDEYNIFDVIIKQNSFEILKDKSTIYSSPIVNFTKNINHIFLGYYDGSSGNIGDTEYDYLFVRKYITTEPTITTTKVGDQFVITITNNLSETLTDYQIKIPAEDLEVYSKFRSLEIIDQSFSPNNNSLAAWIKVPKLSSTEDTVLYMYYGNPNAEEENDSDVWNTDYLLVQHLNETPTNEVGGFLDSTDNSNDGIPAGFDNSETSTTNVDGKINGGVLFGEGDNKINIENSSELNNLNKLTISAWINPDFEVSSVTKQLFIKEIDDSNYIYSLFINDGNLEFGISDGLTIQKISSEEIIRDSWQFVTGVYDGNNLKLYINGENVKTEEITPVIIGETDQSIIIGNNLDYSEDYVGYLDEVRMSNIDKSSAWIKTEYLNQSNPYAFYSFELKEYQ